MTPRPLPQRLYKYRSFNIHTLRQLTQGQIYYSNPRSFNDPLDCSPTIKIDVDSESLEQLCYSMLRCASFSKKQAENIINELRYSSTEYGDYKTDTSVDKYLKQRLGSQIKELLDGEMTRKGIFSLSETWKSPLMWSHYADEHRGVCLEYDTTQMPHPNIATVDYRSPRSVKASDLIEWKLKASSEAELRVHHTYFFSKSPQWRYEKEWRDIIQPSGAHGTSFPISAIYFGLRCELAVITSIVKLFSGHSPIGFFEIYPLDDSFRLKRRKVDRDEIEACGIRTSAILAFKDVVLPK